MAKRRKPSLIIPITDDYKVNLANKYWFIELENYIWLRHATKYFKNVTFKEWVQDQVHPFRKMVYIKILSRNKPKNKRSSFTITGLYDSWEDFKKRKSMSVTFYHWGWPSFSRPMMKEKVLHTFIKTIVHELNHMKQSRKRNYGMCDWRGDYLENPDEIDSFALNSAQSLVTRFGVDEAIEIAKNFKTKDSHCSEFTQYYKVQNRNVRERFIKKVLKYINIYADYKKEHSQEQIFTLILKQKDSLTRKKIKDQAAV